MLIDLLRNYILDELGNAQDEATAQANSQARRKDRLVKEQEKLLQAHYADALPIELMKSEQKRIRNQLEAIDEQLAGATADHELVVGNLEKALAFTANLSQAYREADDKIRRQMNQAIFKKILVDENGVTAVELTKLFGLLLHPELAKSAKKHAGVEVDSVDDLDRMWAQVISPLQTEVENRKTPDLVMVGGLKDNRLVGVEGLEPPTLSV